MTVNLDHTAMVNHLRQYFNNNKARGMVAEMAMNTEFGIQNTPAAQKLLPGGWIISPKNAHAYRSYIAVLPNLYESQEELITATKTLEHDRGWQTIASFLSLNTFGVIVSGAVGTGLDNLSWRNFIYRNDQLHLQEGDAPFSTWEGNRGRPSRGREWSQDIHKRYQAVDTNLLTALTLREAFYSDYLKKTLRKPLEDPYDIDAFVVSFSGKVLPVEVKEKSPTDKGEFGVDAGRILMLLRMCIATDSNALYLIREVDNTENRNLRQWRYITLSDLVMKCRWNLQGGGTGMGGGSTQTIMMPGEYFADFSSDNFSEAWLAKHGSLQNSVRLAAQDLAQGLTHYLK